MGNCSIVNKVITEVINTTMYSLSKGSFSSKKEIDYY